VLLVEQELLTIPEYLSYPRSSCRVGVAQFIVFCVVFLRSLFVILSSDFWLLYCHSIYGFYGLRLMHLQTFLGFSNYNVSVTYFCYFKLCLFFWGRRGRDTTTYAISAYHHWCCEFKSRSWRGVQHYVIKFVSDLRQVGGFLRVLRFPPPIKLTTTI
jgi:hypothetical protein